MNFRLCREGGDVIVLKIENRQSMKFEDGWFEIKPRALLVSESRFRPNRKWKPQKMSSRSNTMYGSIDHRFQY